MLRMRAIRTKLLGSGRAMRSRSCSRLWCVLVFAFLVHCGLTSNHYGEMQDGASKFHLVDEDERTIGVVNIEARYVPCPVVLEPRESINSTFLCLNYYPHVAFSDVHFQTRACCALSCSVAMTFGRLTVEVCRSFRIVKCGHQADIEL